MYICNLNKEIMEILTLEIDETSKKGKALIDFIIAFYSEEGDVQLIAIDGVKVIPNSELNVVAENNETYTVTDTKKGNRK